MKINKSIWIFALIFVLSSVSVFAFELKDIYRNSYFVLIVNGLIIWSLLFVIQMFLIPNQDAKVKLVVWIATFGLAALILWNFTPRGAAYFWEVGLIAQYFKLWIIVNTIIFSLGLYMLAGFLEVKLETMPGKIGLIIVTIVLGALIANNIGNLPLWHKDNQTFHRLYNYFLGPDGPVTKQDGSKVIEGGILTLNKTDIFESRLFVFLISTILFAWFLFSYIEMGNQAKLTYLMAFIIGANLARTGATSGTIIGLGEAFAILIVGKQIAHGINIGSRFWSWTLAIILVEWIFCAVFQQSRLLVLLGGIVKQLLQSNIVSVFLVLYVTWQSLRSLNPKVVMWTAIVGTVVVIGNKITGLLGDLVAGLIDINICGILAQQKIVASAAAGTGTAISGIGGGISQAGLINIPSSAQGPVGVIFTLGTIIIGIFAWNHFKNKV